MKTAADVLAAMHQEMVRISPEATVYDAIRTMSEHNIGSVVVTEDGAILGLYTERDFMQHSLQPGFDPRSTVIREVMTCDVAVADVSDTLVHLQDILLGRRVRHILIKKDGVTVGLLSSGDVMRASLNEATETLKSVSWDYYENWKWHK